MKFISMKLNNKYHNILQELYRIFLFLIWGKKENEEREVNRKNGDKCERRKKMK